MDNKMLLTEETARECKELANAIISEINRVIVGKQDSVRLLVTALIAGGHVLIEDVPGTGKTTLASALAAVSGLEFKRAQFTPDVTASDITGFNTYNRHTEKFEFNQGVVMCNILLADEINRASPKTQSALLEAMEEGAVTVDGETYPLPDPFIVVATQNPTGFVGTYSLPEAQLDRFTLRLTLGYPTRDEEVRMLQDRKNDDPMDKVSPITDTEKIKMLKNAANAVLTDDKILKYAVDLVSGTRKCTAFSIGASPRATLSLVNTAKARAITEGRCFVIPEDVKAVFIPVTEHRVVMKRDAKIAGKTPTGELLDILKATPVPFFR